MQVTINLVILRPSDVPTDVTVVGVIRHNGLFNTCSERPLYQVLGSQLYSDPAFAYVAYDSADGCERMEYLVDLRHREDSLISEALN